MVFSMIWKILNLIFIISYCFSETEGAATCDPKCSFTKDLTPQTIGSFPKNCPTVCGNLTFTNLTKLTDKELKNAFKNLKTLKGGRLSVIGTSFNNLNFLAGLQKIETVHVSLLVPENNQLLELGLKNLTTVIGEYFSVYNNKKMTQFNMPKFKTILSPMTRTYIKNNHPSNFCITSQILKVFLAEKLPNDELQMNGKVCAPKNYTKKNCKIPDEPCEELHGDLNIGANFAVKKVKNLKFLYGSLIVKNTDLANFKFLGNLTYIVQLGEKKIAIDVQGNKKLISAAFPKLKGILCNTWDSVNNQLLDAINFKNNHKSLLEDSKSCFALRSAQYIPQHEIPKFDGKTCGPYSVNISNNAGLEELELTNLTSIYGIFQVTSNPKLRKLKLPKLKTAQLSNTWVNDTAVAIAGNSPQFCLALREAKIFLNYKKVTSFMFDSKVCKPGRQAKKACIVPEIGCVNFIGNLKIGPKFDFKKVKSLKFLYGSLIVKNSSLTDFKIFENLLEIVQLNSTKLAIDVQGNKNLQSATFPKIQVIFKGIHTLLDIIIRPL
ncbi:hypothetical protein B9Z55_012134 [Caenorhabditis nigoni]|uniref:Receptor L-domain domain-containing protein n=1 Tax=Caenorhabditis nigoni TaxID=1611254 RepID=A0A2G5TW00_9PELO|nr:hypothetical protein B9Z55_012134 [Caenorhabditis nigoni]